MSVRTDEGRRVTPGLKHPRHSRNLHARSHRTHLATAYFLGLSQCGVDSLQGERVAVMDGERLDDFVDQYDIVRKQYILETQLFYRQLAKVPGTRTYPSMANFALVEILGGVSADDVTQHLLVRHGVYVRTCSDKIGLDGDFLRIASRGLRDNQRIIDALTDVLGA